MSRERCPWAGSDPLYQAYHDEEWGVPVHDDRRLFEMLILEGAQAGLSWITILRKREHYRKVYDGFDPEKVARYGPEKTAALLADPGIVRNRAKVAASVAGARAVLDIQEEHGSLDAFLWSFVDGEPVVSHPHDLSDLPSETAASRAMSKALKARGCNFVGPTICYAFMQAAGMVDDHLVSCFRYRDRPL